MTRVEVVRAVYAAWNGGEWGMEHFDPDVEWEMVGVGALDQAGATRGRDALRDYFRQFFSAWKPGTTRWEIAELRELGDDRVLAACVMHVVGRASGLESSLALDHLWTVRDSRVVGFVSYNDHEAALKAARQ